MLPKLSYKISAGLRIQSTFGQDSAYFHGPDPDPDSAVENGLDPDPTKKRFFSTASVFDLFSLSPLSPSFFSKEGPVDTPTSVKTLGGGGGGWRRGLPTASGGPTQRFGANDLAIDPISQHTPSPLILLL